VASINIIKETGGGNSEKFPVKPSATLPRNHKRENSFASLDTGKRAYRKGGEIVEVLQEGRPFRSRSWVLIPSRKGRRLDFIRKKKGDWLKREGEEGVLSIATGS